MQTAHARAEGITMGIKWRTSLMQITRLIHGTALLHVLLMPACDDTTGSRFPLDTERQWDPNLPPAIFWDYAAPVTNNDNLREGLSLRSADGKLLEFSVMTSESAAWLCVEGGLEPETVYTWKVSTFGDEWHQSAIPEHDAEGTWSFQTSAETTHTPPGEDCALPDSDAYTAGSASLDTGDFFPEDDPDDGRESLSVVWGPASITLSISDLGDDNAAWFGLAETGCGDPSSCWYGEDCIYGYENYFYCHPSSPTGVELDYGADINTLQEGINTLFTNDSFDGTVTYYVESDSQCWTWGHDPSYYAGLGCQD